MKRLALLVFVAAAAACQTQGAPSRTSPPRAVTAQERDALALGYGGDGEGTPEDRCPGPENGSELVGREAPPWHLVDWRNGPPVALSELRGRVVVVRFWIASGCPYCERSLPSLAALARELDGKPVTIVGALHGKPASSVKDMDRAAAVAKEWDVSFPLALDDDWKTLRSWWVDGVHHRHATSATFVIGKDGRFVHVHPGPMLDAEPARDERAHRDFLALRSAVLAAL